MAYNDDPKLENFGRLPATTRNLGRDADTIPTQVHQTRCPADGAVPRGGPRSPCRPCSAADGRADHDAAAAPTGCNFSLPDKKTMRNDARDQQLSPRSASKLNAIKMDANKSPVSKLTEVLTLMKKPLDYAVVSVEGEMHSPHFVIEAKSGDLAATGSGSSKKEAKKQAAIALLKKLDVHISNDTITSTTPNHLPPPLCEIHALSLTSNKPLNINFVGELQELCMFNHWSLPNYQCSYNNTDLDNPYYSVICTLMNFKSEGAGKTKQAAKKIAAQLMYDHIKNLIITKPDDYCFNSEYRTSSKIMSNNNSINDVVDTKENTKLYSNTIQNSNNKFYSNLKSSNNSGLKKLKDFDVDSFNFISAVQLLNQIADEECFVVSYRMISQISINIIILVEVSLNPVVVHAGTGRSIEEAKESGARTVLVYLKLLLQK